MQSDINKWRAQISRCHLSGRTPEDWCRTRWIPVREFYRWEAALEAPTQGMSEKEARNAVFKFLWRTRIADCEASEMNTSSWCCRNNVSRNSYYRWKRRFNAQDAEGPGTAGKDAGSWLEAHKQKMEKRLRSGTSKDDRFRLTVLRGLADGKTAREARQDAYKELWHTRIAHYASYRTDISTWCERNRVSRNSFFRWKRRLVPGNIRTAAELLGWYKSKLEECRNSGMTITDWCASQGISRTTYSCWRKAVRQAADADPGIEETAVSRLDRCKSKLEEYRNSGMTITDWCASQGISRMKYYRMQKAVRRAEDANSEIEIR